MQLDKLSGMLTLPPSMLNSSELSPLGSTYSISYTIHIKFQQNPLSSIICVEDHSDHATKLQYAYIFQSRRFLKHATSFSLFLTMVAAQLVGMDVKHNFGNGSTLFHQSLVLIGGLKVKDAKNRQQTKWYEKLLWLRPGELKIKDRITLPRWCMWITNKHR